MLGIRDALISNPCTLAIVSTIDTDCYNQNLDVLRSHNKKYYYFLLYYSP